MSSPVSASRTATSSTCAISPISSDVSQMPVPPSLNCRLAHLLNVTRSRIYHGACCGWAGRHSNMHVSMFPPPGPPFCAGAAPAPGLRFDWVNRGSGGIAVTQVHGHMDIAGAGGYRTRENPHAPLTRASMIQAVPGRPSAIRSFTNERRHRHRQRRAHRRSAPSTARSPPCRRMSSARSRSRRRSSAPASSRSRSPR